MELVKISYYKDNTYVYVENMVLVYDDEHYFGYISPYATRPEDMIEIKKDDIEALKIEKI